MKKITFIALVISIFLLSSCSCSFFGLLDDEKEAQDSAAITDERPVAEENSEQKTPIEQAPSFQDGDYYLQAMSSKNAETCSRIQNNKLRERCETKLSGSDAQN